MTVIYGQDLVIVFLVLVKFGHNKYKQQICNSCCSIMYRKKGRFKRKKKNPDCETDSGPLYLKHSYLSLFIVGQLPLQSGLLGLPVGRQLQPLVLLHNLLMVQLPGFILEEETTSVELMYKQTAMEWTV